MGVPIPKRMPIKPAGGGGRHFPLAEKSIRLARHGCANRPFYHIVVLMTRRHQHDQPIEQLGTYDPLPNQNNEKLVSLNLERMQYWLAQRSVITKPVATLLGLSGLLPLHPSTYSTAWIKRRELMRELAEQKESTDTKDENQSDA